MALRRSFGAHRKPMSAYTAMSSTQTAGIQMRFCFNSGGTGVVLALEERAFKAAALIHTLDESRVAVQSAPRYPRPRRHSALVVLDQSLAFTPLPRRQRIAAARERILLAAELDAHRRAA